MNTKLQYLSGQNKRNDREGGREGECQKELPCNVKRLVKSYKNLIHVQVHVHTPL